MDHRDLKSNPVNVAVISARAVTTELTANIKEISNTLADLDWKIGGPAMEDGVRDYLLCQVYGKIFDNLTALKQHIEFLNSTVPSENMKTS